MNNKLAARQILQNDFAIVTVLALFKLIFHLATSSGYGYFRDELYYIAASKHLAWGYVDFPPFVAFITAITRILFGESLFALHLFPALAGALIVLLAGLMARELGGGKLAQGLAALAVLVAPQFLAFGALLTMDAFYQLWWALAAYVVILIFKRDDPRLWLAFGIIAGIGLMTKVTMAYFGGALVVGILLTPHRKYLASKWLWLGGVIALVIFSPYILWQIANGFPTLDFWKMYASGKTYPVTPLEFIAQQIIIMNPLLLPLWLAGSVYYLFARDGIKHRPLGIAYVILFVVFMLQQAKSYFLAPAYPMLFAAGAFALEQFIARRAWSWLKPTYATLLIVSGALMAPMAMPLLPVEMFIEYT
jgi:4-amino-4-deoxy-L-arabinose transferase-like glycosyltransferase